MERNRNLHVLLIAKDTSTYLDRSYFYLETELAKKTQLSVWRTSGHIQTILQKLSIQPDFILLVQDIGSRFEPMIHGLAEIPIPSAVFVNDVHRFTETRRSFLRKNRNTHLFSVTRYACMDEYSEFEDRMEWFPHFIHPSIFKDYQFNKDIGILMLGKVDKTYPFRNYVKQVFQMHPQFLTRTHPGYTFFEDPYHKLVGERYAMELNKAKIFITCPSIYTYPVKKYFEALACSTLLLAPHFDELGDLGFKPGEHFVQVDQQTVLDAVTYYLYNEVERNTITKKGYAFMHETHTISIRTNQLIKKMEEII